MKRSKLTIVLVSALLLGTVQPASAKGGFWKTLKSFGKGLVEAAGGVVIEKVAVKGGYSAEQAHEFREQIYNAVGANNRNADLGIAYREGTKLDKSIAVKEMVWENSGLQESPYADALRTVKEFTDVQWGYLKAKELMPDRTREEDFALKVERNMELSDIAFNAYAEAKERRAKSFAKKTALANQLMQKGYTDPQLADEVAGTIISIRRSDLPQDEKDQLIAKFGLTQETQEIWQQVDELLSVDYVPEEETSPEPQPQLSAEELLAQEREAALSELVKTQIDAFALNAVELSADNRQALDRAAEVMQKYDDVNILLTGHTCDLGSDKVNQKKGLQRAEAAKGYLMEKGIAETRIQTESKGASEPLTDATTEPGRAQNRRVAISLK